MGALAVPTNGHATLSSRSVSSVDPQHHQQQAYIIWASPPSAINASLDNASASFLHNGSDFSSLDGSHGRPDQLNGCNQSRPVCLYNLLIARSEFTMRDELIRYVIPVIIILGNISNLTALIIFRRKKLSSSSVSLYICAYAIANLCVLDLVQGIAWICYVFELPYITSLADWTCRLWMFLTNVMTYSGIWFVVVMNIDRFVYIKTPAKAQGYCTLFIAKAIVTFVVVGLVVVSIHAMWTYELQPQGCWVSIEQDLHTIIWPWWSATVYSYIPLALLLVLSMAQIITLLIRQCRNAAIPVARGNGADNYVVAVLVVSISFFVFTVPSTVVNLLDINLPPHWLDVIARLEVAKKVTEIFSSLNNAVLGIILFACSSTFRVELVALLRQLNCFQATPRTLKGFEMRNVSNSEDSSPHIQVDYELCNNKEDTVTDV